jgi:uncharacterized protein (DUF1697 family)
VATRALVALLRAVNVGGTGKLAMTDLAALCERAGLTRVRTYIQSGNVVFESALAEAAVKAKLEKALAAKVGKPIGVLVRTSAEMQRLVARSPFPDVEPNRVIVVFYDESPGAERVAGWPVPGREQLTLRGRELFIHYPDGMGRSKLAIPWGDRGTARNMNTVRKLAELALALESGE